MGQVEENCTVLDLLSVVSRTVQVKVCSKMRRSFAVQGSWNKL